MTIHEGDEGDALVDAHLREELEALSEALATPPPARLRPRVLEIPLHGRWDRFADSVASLLDVDRARAIDVLSGLDEPEPFQPGPFPLPIALRHIEGGPGARGSITGFVRVACGATFPEHEHLGREHVLVLQGHLHDEITGEVHGPGALVTREPGTVHAISALDGGADLVYLAVVERGVKIDEVVMTPESPEL